MSSNRKQRKTRKMKGGGKGGPVFNMSNMLSALKNTTKTKLKTKSKFRITKKKTPKFATKYMNVINSNKKTKKHGILKSKVKLYTIKKETERRSALVINRIEKLRKLYNDEENDIVRDFYGSIEQELREKIPLIFGDLDVSEEPFVYLSSLEEKLENEKYGEKTLKALYLTFNTVMREYIKQKDDIVNELKETLESKKNAKEVDDELSALFAGFGI
jgi:hypothetical protein